MRLIDEQYLKTPTYGSRSMARHFRRHGRKVNRRRIQRLMRLMGIEAIYPKPHTSRPHPEHKIYPYLLRDLRIDHANQVWATDITYVPMARGFMYLVAVMDWHSRKILSWRLSNTLRTSAIRPSRTLSAAMESLRSSTRIKEHSLPATGSHRSSRTTGSTSAWTAVADARITFSLNGYGGPSSITTFTCIRSAAAPSCVMG
jgi:transposase InsO family protein